jgi:hypothetical protein
MKTYRKPLTYSAGAAAPVSAPVYFTLNSIDDPVKGQRCAMVYGHDGRYLGFTTDLDAIQKYLYGQLYYRTKRAYRVSSNRRCDGSKVKKITIITRVANTIALYIQVGLIGADHLLDTDDINLVSERALIEVQRYVPTHWSFSRYPDKFKLLKDANFEQKFEKEFDEMVVRQKQEVIAYIEAKRDAQNGLNDLAMFRTGNNKLALAG